MRYLGIDPGTTRIGFGIIEDDGGALRANTWGILTAEHGAPGVADALNGLIREWHPEAAAVEKLFFLNNKRSAMAVSEMRGVLMLTLTQQHLPIYEFTPLQVKQQVCGHGRADKSQVERVVRMILKLREPILPDDAADALALALCCSTVHSSR
jgi:crossover junction endodeoxyribonuclease RuvC